MSHSTTETYKMKRGILNYSGKISAPLRKPDRKFFAEMLYGILASGSCLLSEITQELHESTKKINVVDRLSRHLAKGIPQKFAALNFFPYFLSLLFSPTRFICGN